MIKNKQKWLTCTPKRFVGDESFFVRDSGLLSEGFRSLGHETQSIMLGPVREDDDPRCLRASMAELESPDFWAAFEAVGVVFYAWGMPQYTSIAKAIKQAGLFLVIHLDTGGLMSPRVDGADYRRLLFDRYQRDGSLIFGTLKAIASWSRGMIPLLFDEPRINHLALGDLIGTVSLTACDRVQRFAKYYRRVDVAKKVKLILHPISPSMRYTGETKLEQICVVGRWTENDAVKQPQLMLSVLQKSLEEKKSYQAVVIGGYDEAFAEKHAQIPERVRSRISLMGRLPNEEAAKVIVESQISLCTSVSESFHIASAEALCCGCSLVSYESPYLPSFEYFVSDDFGTLAKDGSGAAIASALIDEISYWQQGDRDPQAISETWSARVHAPNVAQSIMDYAGKVMDCRTIEVVKC